MKYIDVTLEVLINSMILSIVAAGIRVFFTRMEKYEDTLRMFIGSILFGVVIGYVLNDFSLLKPYLKIIIVVFSIFGKELFNWLAGLFKDPGKGLTIVFGILKSVKSMNISFSTKNNQDDGAV